MSEREEAYLLRGKIQMDDSYLGGEHPGGKAGLIQSVSQAFLPVLRAWVEVGGIAPSQCPKAFLPQPISI